MTYIRISNHNQDLLPMLKYWLRENDASALIEEVQTEENIVWSDQKLDTETHLSVLDNIERKAKGDTSHLIEIKDLKEQSYFEANKTYFLHTPQFEEGAADILMSALQSERQAH